MSVSPEIMVKSNLKSKSKVLPYNNESVIPYDEISWEVEETMNCAKPKLFYSKFIMAKSNKPN